MGVIQSVAWLLVGAAFIAIGASGALTFYWVIRFVKSLAEPVFTPRTAHLLALLAAVVISILVSYLVTVYALAATT